MGFDVPIPTLPCIIIPLVGARTFEYAEPTDAFPAIDILLIGVVVPIPSSPVFVNTAFVVNVPPLLLLKFNLYPAVSNLQLAFVISVISKILFTVPVPITILPLTSTLYRLFLIFELPTVKVFNDAKLLLTISILQTLILQTVIVPRTFRFEEIFTLPTISRFVIGFEVPIPMNPLSVILNLSIPPVTNPRELLEA